MKTVSKAIGLSCLAMLTACKDKGVTEVEKLPLVKAIEISVLDFNDKLYFPAVANAAEKAHLSFRVAGEIFKLDVKEGEQVKKGDVLAELD
ncbi:biotin/lipoyl-binding protein, partial [Vibrio sp. 10N.222.51.A6]